MKSIFCIFPIWFHWPQCLLLDFKEYSFSYHSWIVSYIFKQLRNIVKNWNLRQKFILCPQSKWTAWSLLNPFISCSLLLLSGKQIHSLNMTKSSQQTEIMECFKLVVNVSLPGNIGKYLRMILSHVWGFPQPFIEYWLGALNVCFPRYCATQWRPFSPREPIVLCRGPVSFIIIFFSIYLLWPHYSYLWHAKSTQQRPPNCGMWA